MYDGFDEDPQVLSRLPGFVSFEADAEPRWAAVIKRHLEHKLFLPILRHKEWPAGHLVLLGGMRESNGGRSGETSMKERAGWGQGEGEETEVNSLGLNSLQKLN